MTDRDLAKRREVAAFIALTIVAAFVTGFATTHHRADISPVDLSIAIALLAGLTACYGALAAWVARG